MGFLKFMKLKIRGNKRVKNNSKIVALGGREDDDNGVEESGRKFTWEEIQKMTMNFSQVIGYGGFSTVYSASPVAAGHPNNLRSRRAVKIFHSGSERLSRLWKQELETLLCLRRHESIVKFLGYCHDREGVLVFEYVPNGTLQEMLHGSTDPTTNNRCKTRAIISWERRMVIACQLAQALEYLHKQCSSLPIVHGDIKASNILLDEQLNCKLCDFGSSKMGFTSSVTTNHNRMILGSTGYVDPHYLTTGLPSTKNDVYSFGVVILELLTGTEAFCWERSEMLTSIAGGVLINPSMIGEMVDPSLRYFDLEEAKTMASISAACLCPTPTLRPSTSDILRTMREKIPSVSFLFLNQKTI